MKMMQGAFFLPCSKRSRTRLAPTPTNISTKSEPEIEKKGTLASPATARASRVFPVPGRSDEQHALGDAAAEALELLGFAEELDDLLELFLGFVYAGDVLEGDLLLLHGQQAGAALAEAHGLVSTGLHLAHHEEEEAEQKGDGRERDERIHPKAGGPDP